MNSFADFKNLLVSRLLREVKRKVGKEGQMTKENKEGQSCQRQIDFLGGVEEGGEVKKDETLPVSIEPALPQEFVKAEKNLEWLGFFTPSNRRTRKRADEKVMSK